MAVDLGQLLSLLFDFLAFVADLVDVFGTEFVGKGGSVILVLFVD